MIGTIVAVALMIVIVCLEWFHIRDRRYMTNIIIARNPNEARILNNETPQPVYTPPPAEDIDGFDGPVGI